jgi:hypothetical protein
MTGYFNTFLFPDKRKNVKIRCVSICKLLIDFVKGMLFEVVIYYLISLLFSPKTPLPAPKVFKGSNPFFSASKLSR